MIDTELSKKKTALHQVCKKQDHLRHIKQEKANMNKYPFVLYKHRNSAYELQNVHFAMRTS